MGEPEKEALKQLATLPTAVASLETAIAKINGNGKDDKLDIEKFSGVARRNGEYGLESFIREIDLHCEASASTDKQRANLLYRNCIGIAREELQCLAKEDIVKPMKIKKALRARFGAATSGLATFFCRHQLADESLGGYLCALQQIFDGLVSAQDNLQVFDNSKTRITMLIQQVIDGAKNPLTRNNIILEKEDLSGMTWSGARTRILQLGQPGESHRVRSLTTPFPRGSIDFEYDDYHRSPGASASAAPVVQDSSNTELLKQLLESNKQMCEMMKMLSTRLGEPGNRKPESRREPGIDRPPPQDDKCRYCKESGHFKNSCPKLARKERLRAEAERANPASSAGSDSPRPGNG